MTVLPRHVVLEAMARVSRPEHAIARAAGPRELEVRAALGTTFTYFVANDAANAVKIGSAADPEKRLGQLQVANATPLRLIGYLPVSLGDERFEGAEEGLLQHLYAEHRIRGEWFRLDAPELAATLELAADFAAWHLRGEL